ncbi:MAG: tRNA pseudouridine(55) synthase TruB [Chlamydiae bacterium]|nr:tRNA pseudouridine(55) synthase TruB [Chlamydiota bacterium]
MKTNSDEEEPSREGLLLIDKPPGKTSFYLVQRLRHLTGIDKIGHAGTLDPFATGVMLLLVGKSFTRLSEKFMQSDKQYLATLQLGAVSTTYDCDGIITPYNPYVPSAEEIYRVLQGFQGEVLQTPPMYSAKKIKGKKLYELARRGIEIAREPQKVHLQTLLVEYHYPYLTLDVSCSKGTYIRSLAEDFGKALGTGAYLEQLVRLRCGEFYLEDCLSYDLLNSPEFDYTKHLLQPSMIC